MHKRDRFNKQRRLARLFVLQSCFRDRELQEGVNIKTSADISIHLSEVTQEPVEQAVPSAFLKGEVLFDGYGRGSLQNV